MDQALVDIIARLYAAPPEAFVAARDEAVAAARTAGDRKLATTIGKLRKPTLGAWLVNLLAHERSELIVELLELGEALRQAQRQLQGAQLRELSQQRRQVVARLAREARALAVAAGRGAGDPLPLAEVEATLTAALADEGVAEEVRAGRLTRPVEYAGFGDLPRPQLRVVSGGESATRAAEAALAEAAPAEAAPAQPAPAEVARAEAAPAEAALAEAAPAQPAQPAPAEVAAAERAAAEQAERAQRAEQAERAQRAEAERVDAARRRNARAAAHRELLAARTALAEAEAVRAEAERAVVAARRRVQTALARATEIDAG